MRHRLANVGLDCRLNMGEAFANPRPGSPPIKQRVNAAQADNHLIDLIRRRKRRAISVATFGSMVPAPARAERCRNAGS